MAEREIAALSLPTAFWRCLLDYLLDTSSPIPQDASRRSFYPAGLEPEVSSFAIPFPCLLSERVVIDGAETDVLLTMFTAHALQGGSGEVFLHPEQIALRCMDPTFINSFTQAAAVLRRHLADYEGGLPDFCLRLHTLRPDHEGFWQGITLRGGSGSGALALTLYGQLFGLSSEIHGLAASFAFDSRPETEAVPCCIPVNGAAEKVRSCAMQEIHRLMVAASQQEEVALYGRRNGVEILGVQTFADAVAHLNLRSRNAPPRRMPEMFPLRALPGEEEGGGIVPSGSRYYVTVPRMISATRRSTSVP